MRVIHLLMLVIVSLASCQTSQTSAPRTWEIPPGVKTVRVNGYDMAYVEQGSGTAVVLIPGSGSDYRYFAAQMEPFAQHHRVISVSLRHFYPEPWNGEGEFSLNQHTEDLVAFIRQLNAGPVHLVGHSRGGTLALYVAKAAPELVRSLSLSEPASGMRAFMPASATSSDNEKRLALYREMAEKFAAGNKDAGLVAFANFVNGPGAWDTMSETARQWYRDNAWTFLASDNDGSHWASYTCEDAQRIEAPILLLRSEKITPPMARVQDNLQPCLRHVEQARIMNSSHSMPRINPPAFNVAVLAFIDAH
jgi:pimeloyl-ACP methyl ester carboxylesterase